MFQPMHTVIDSMSELTDRPFSLHVFECPPPAGGDVGQLEMELCNEELLKGSEEEISELEDFLSQTDDDRLIAKYHGVNLSDRK